VKKCLLLSASFAECSSTPEGEKVLTKALGIAVEDRHPVKQGHEN